MVELWIPYGDVEVPVRVPDENLAWLVDPGANDAKQNLDAIRSAIRSPLETKGLSEIAKIGSKIAIAFSGSPRFIEKSRLLQIVLEEIFSSEVPPSEVEVIISAGADSAKKELDNLNSLLRECKLSISDPEKGKFVEAGVTSFGTKVQLNRTFADADLRIVVGEVYANWFSGFVGPWNVVLGICSKSTISQNGMLALKRGVKKRPKWLQNSDVHQDIKEVASMANIDFSLSVLPSRDGMIHAAFAGFIDKVYEKSLELSKRYFYKIPKKVDILLVGSGGLPFDSNLVNACDALFNFEDAIDKDGRIVLVAECRDGPGEGTFLDLIYRFRDSSKVLGEIRKNFSLEGYKAMKLLELLEKHGISIVSTMPLFFSEKVLSFRTADTASEGLQNAFRFLGKDSKIGVVIDGSSSVAEGEFES
ncbi:MAG: lactate racemase domain-containing protein [Thermoproteota archaeon]